MASVKFEWIIYFRIIKTSLFLYGNITISLWKHHYFFYSTICKYFSYTYFWAVHYFVSLTFSFSAIAFYPSFYTVLSPYFTFSFVLSNVGIPFSSNFVYLTSCRNIYVGFTRIFFSFYSSFCLFSSYFFRIASIFSYLSFIKISLASNFHTLGSPIFLSSNLTPRSTIA